MSQLSEFLAFMTFHCVDPNNIGMEKLRLDFGVMAVV